MKDKLKRIKLLNMKKPDVFFIVTYDEYKDQKQITWHQPIINLIIENGYNMVKQGIDPENKYYWKFVNRNNKQALKEHDEDEIKFKPRDEKWHEEMKKESAIIFESLKKKGLVV